MRVSYGLIRSAEPGITGKAVHSPQVTQTAKSLLRTRLVSERQGCEELGINPGVESDSRSAFFFTATGCESNALAFDHTNESIEGSNHRCCETTPCSENL